MMNQFHMKLRYRTEPKPELQPQPSTKIRRDVVGRRPEGETIPSGLRPDEDNEVTGHIRRNAGPCLRSEQGDVIMRSTQYIMFYS